jgi:50S ribosomal subunit-associated GTPase HflX
MEGSPAMSEHDIERDIEASRRRVAADIDELARLLDGRALLRRALRRAAVPAVAIVGGVAAWLVLRRS